MSEKEKMKSEEIAKVLAENPTAKIYLAGLAQGMKLAKSMEPEAFFGGAGPKARKFSRYEGIFGLPQRGSGKSKGVFFEEIFAMMYCDALFLI